MKISKREITKCSHVERVFYAKGMCKNCYHAMGREKKTDACPHVDRPKYAHGVCKNCYLSKYHRERRAQRKLAAQMEKKKELGDRMDINNVPKPRKRKSYVRVSARPAILMTVDAVGELQNKVDEQSCIKTFEAACTAAACSSDPQR